jgi:predicted  nucleic acid-binding Zn-ribbon protein
MAKKKAPPARSKDIPATLGMLHLVRDELRSDIRALEHKTNAGLNEVKSAIDKMSSSIHQMQLLAEEQRAENRIVMDGLTNLFSRQERIEDQIDSLQKTLLHLKR